MSIREMILNNQSFNILDFTLKLFTNKDNKINFLSNVHTKPVGAYQYVPYNSEHPMAVKTAIIEGEITERSRICNNITDLKYTLKDLLRKLTSCLYPKNLIIKEYKNFFKGKNMDTLEEERKVFLQKLKVYSIQTGCPFIYNFKKPDVVNTTLMVPLIIPYHACIHKGIQEWKKRLQWTIMSLVYNHKHGNKFKDIRLVTAYTRGRSIKDIINHNKLKEPEEGITYIRNTKRPREPLNMVLPIPQVHNRLIENRAYKRSKFLNCSLSNRTVRIFFFFFKKVSTPHTSSP